MARALDLPRFSGTRSLTRIRPSDDCRSEQWLRVRSIECPPWLKEVFDSLDRVGTLQSNWDSYGSRPASPGAIQAAKTLLSNVNVERISKPAVAAVPGGNVGFHWRIGFRDLEIEIGEHEMTFLKTDLADPTRNIEGEIPSFKQAQEVLDWIIAL